MPCLIALSIGAQPEQAANSGRAPTPQFISTLPFLTSLLGLRARGAEKFLRFLKDQLPLDVWRQSARRYGTRATNKIKSL